MSELQLSVSGNDGFSRPIYGVLGEFTKNLEGERPICVPYFVGVASFEQLSNDIKLVTDDPKYAEQNWKIQELFQRDIDEHRAYLIAKQYLSDQARGEVPFFNAITIALRTNGSGFTEKDGVVSLGEGTESANSHGIAVSAVPAIAPGNVACLRWHSDAVSAFAIDGQHRLSAIKSFCREGLGNAKKNFGSLVVLLLDESLGFRGFVDPGPDATLQAMRKFFIDLNKKAKTVSTSRQLLLDDQDPVALCVRRMIGESLEVTEDFDNPNTSLVEGAPIGTDGSFFSRIPLSLVDWHSEDSAKVNTGPYLHSLLSLAWLTGVISGKLKRFKYFNPPAFNIAENDPYRPIKSSLKDGPPDLVGPILGRLEKCQDLEAPFALTGDEKTAIADSFEEIWARPIARISLHAPGYREVVEQRLQGSTVTSPFSNWYQIEAAVEACNRTSTPAEVVSSYQKRQEEIRDGLGLESVSAFRAVCKGIAEVKNDQRGREHPLFLLVGQRAMFLAFFRICDFFSGDRVSFWAETLPQFYSPACPYDGLAKAYVEALGFWDSSSHKSNPLWNVRARVKRTHQGKGFSTAFWNASLLRKEDDQTVDFSGQAAQRGSKWFRFLFFWWLANTVQERGSSEWRQLMKKTAVDGVDFPGSGEETTLRWLKREMAALYSPGASGKYNAPCFYAAKPPSDDYDQKVVAADACSFFLDRCWALGEHGFGA